MKNQIIQFYYDTAIIESLLTDHSIKTAQSSGLIAQIITAVKGYITDKIHKGTEVEDVVNLLVPGILTVLGFPILGTIVEVAESWFGFKITDIFKQIASEVKSVISGNKQVSSSTIDHITENAVNSNSGKSITEDPTQLLNLFKSQSLSINEVMLYKEAIIKTSVGIGSSIARLVEMKSTTARILMTVIGWIVTVILASAGFIVADDVVHSLIGSPDKRDLPSITDQSTTPLTPQDHQTSLPASTQTVFKVNPGYREEKLNLNDRWIEPVPPDQIAEEVINWAKDIYPDLKNSDEEIKSSPAFNNTIQVITKYNRTNTSNITFMPRIFSSRKKVVDMFIDDVAERTPTHSIPLAQPQDKQEKPLI